MSEELIIRLKAPVSISMFATKTDLYMEVLQQRKDAASRIEELEQKLRTTSLEALAISDTNNEMAVRIAQLEKERDAAIEAEDEAKDCFWAVYPTYCKVIGAGISTEAARTRLAVRAEIAEARLSEAVKVLGAVVGAETFDLHVGYDGGVGGGSFVYADVVRTDSDEFRAAKAFITTLGGEKE